MLPSFPAFTTLGPEHRPLMDTICSRFEPYADYSFTNLFTWSMDGKNEVAQLNGNLVVRLPDYMTGETTMYCLLGEKNIDESLDLLLTVCDSVSLVPEAVVERIGDPFRFIITPERDQFDYIYDLRALADMPGADLKKKRNKVNRFVKDFAGQFNVQTYNKLSAATVKEIEGLFERWVTDCNKTVEESQTERLALRNMLVDIELLNLQITAVSIDGKMCAFSAHEIVANNKAICHFEKALPVHEGLYAFVINESAKHLMAQGVKQVNWQQDLGLPGLRSAKTTYHPIGFLRKYSVARAV